VPEGGAGELPADWDSWRDQVALTGYDERWRRMAEAGVNPHGEADLVSWYRPSSVLDGGCGTGRVAIELARRGVRVLGVDADPDMISAARAKAPSLRWRLADLTELDAVLAAEPDAVAAEPDAVAAKPGAAKPGAAPPTETDELAAETDTGPDRFDVVVLAGNVVPYIAAEYRPAAVAACARALSARGRLIAGFSLRAGWPSVDDYDRWCLDAGLVAEDRFASWDRDPYAGGDYLVAVHRRTP
jgi:SAM-dependent methyltransferase